MTDTDPLIGRELAGRYRLTQRLGGGGMGAVYIALQRSLAREVVVKVMHQTYASDPSYRERFVREARSISALSHPHIISVFDFGLTEDGLLFLAMERLRGRSLHRLLFDDGALAEPRVLHIAESVCSALAEVHALGIVHRDLKPENVFVTATSTGEEVVKVLDFGLVKNMSAPDAQPAPGIIVGTPGYMSPEQMSGGHIGPASDLYALGLLWWEMLVGHGIYPEIADLDARMQKQLADGVPRVGSATDRALVAGHEDIVTRLLANDPAARPTDAASLLREIRALSDAARTPTAPTARVPIAPIAHTANATPAPTQGTSPTPAPLTPAPTAPQPRLRAAYAIVAVLLLAALIGALLLLR